MNADLGRKVLDHVTAHREQFDMGGWGYRDGECGTVACLAGWAMLLSGYTLTDAKSIQPPFARPDGTFVDDESFEAMSLLGLSDAEYYGGDEEPCTLFGPQDEDHAIGRFRALVEAAEAS